MYMFLAYQSPCSGTHCGLQCAQMPNFASRNHSGQRYDFRDSQNGKNGPSGIFPAKKGDAFAVSAMNVASSDADVPDRNDLRCISASTETTSLSLLKRKSVLLAMSVATHHVANNLYRECFNVAIFDI